jgi:hypothetical protein
MLAVILYIDERSKVQHRIVKNDELHNKQSLILHPSVMPLF